MAQEKLQNEDVKGEAELISKGGDKTNLIHDTKIYSTEFDKTLADAIADGNIGSGGGGGGIGLKARGFALSDGSTEEHNVQTPFVNGGSNTQITTDFEVKDNELVRFFHNGNKIPEYISDTKTPAPYYKKIDTFNFEMDRDYTLDACTIEIEVYSGVEPPEIVPSILAGLSVKFEGFYETDVDGVEVSGNTVIDLGFEVLNSDVGMVFVEGAFACPDISLGYVHSWQLVENNKIELLGDHTASNLKVYVVFFEGTSAIDAFGNICLTLRPKLTSFIVESPSLQKHSVKVSNSSQLETVQVVSGVVDPIRLYRDDLTVCSIEVTDLGELVVNDSPTPGILFEDVYLAQDSGLAWKLFINNSNELYIIDAQGNTWSLKDQLGENLHQIKQTEDGTFFYTKYWQDCNDLPVTPTQITNSVLSTWCLDDDGLPAFKMWDTLNQIWKKFYKEGDLIDNLPLGTVIHSLLTEDEFLAEMQDLTGNRWKLLAGADINGSDLGDLKGWSNLPNARGVFLRADNTGNGDLTQDEDRVTRIKHESDGSMLASYQQDSIQFHNHWISNESFDSTGGVGGVPRMPNRGGGFNSTDWDTGNGATSAREQGNYAQETRPRNINTNTFVKIRR